ncbi:hypothetical protein PVAND_006016 [Polypedilum vanderplanki]|uniref:Uncharacterized protein n=1 Tax=Polypedilum vanderplanki TaxID=319348 RepID=A0A9J6C2A3_POLVA|nr:hypothetical protein PVAND_006016 [Polypedilum vanderplanki]
MQTVKIKIVVIGSQLVGKTSLLNAIVRSNNSISDDEYKPFDNVSTMTVKVIKDDKTYIFELWDSKSIDYYKIIQEMKNEEISVVLICYSVMELKSFQDVKKKWLPMIRKSAPNSHVIIVGTKIDLRDDRVSLLRLDRLQNLKPITIEEGYLFTRENNAYFPNVLHFHKLESMTFLIKLFQYLVIHLKWKRNVHALFYK